MNVKDKSLNATENFISHIKLKSKFLEFKAETTVYDLQENFICNSKSICRFSDDCAYMDRIIYIQWEFNDDVMRQLNLHGYYNTNFQIFVFENGCFKIIDNKNDRIIKLYGEG